MYGNIHGNDHVQTEAGHHASAYRARSLSQWRHAEPPHRRVRKLWRLLGQTCSNSLAPGTLVTKLWGMRAPPLHMTRLAANSIDAAEESLEDIVGTAMVDLVRVKVLVEDPWRNTDGAKP